MSQPVRVVVVDDHAMFRAGVRAELAAARTRLGLTVDQLADRTRIRPHVIEAVEVDVEKDAAPRPLGSSHAGEVRHLGVGAVAACDVKAVSPALRLVGEIAGGATRAGNRALLREASLVTAAEHLDDEKVIVSVAVDVGKVNAHR